MDTIQDVHSSGYLPQWKAPQDKQVLVICQLLFKRRPFSTDYIYRSQSLQPLESMIPELLCLHPIHSWTQSCHISVHLASLYVVVGREPLSSIFYGPVRLSTLKRERN
jgi:hypothetical protein